MALAERQHFLLGLFGPNCASGLPATTIPERWVNSWENNVKLAQMVDDAGFDFILPIARWVGFGGETNFHGDVLEAITWAAGILASTKNIHIVATVHTGFHNPVVVAKQMATLDAISKSRVGLNIVAGWNQPEYEALGVEMPPHDERYVYSQEWYDIVRKIWTNKEPFNHEGKYWKLKDVLCEPLPARQPTIINAGGSGEGKNYAARNADLLFTVINDLKKAEGEVADLKAKALASGDRKVDVVTPIMIICRPTEQEAKDYYKYYAEDHADRDASKRVVEGLIVNSSTWSTNVFEQVRKSFASGFGSYTIVGTPRQVADGLIEVHKAGLGGAALGFVDYIKEFPYWRDEVLPLLEQAGLRKPVNRTS